MKTIANWLLESPSGQLLSCQCYAAADKWVMGPHLPTQPSCHYRSVGRQVFEMYITDLCSSILILADERKNPIESFTKLRCYQNGWIFGKVPKREGGSLKVVYLISSQAFSKDRTDLTILFFTSQTSITCFGICPGHMVSDLLLTIKI